MTREQEDEMIEAAIMNANNMGQAVDMYHPDYGQILKDGFITEAGVKFFDDRDLIFEKSNRMKGHVV